MKFSDHQEPRMTYLHEIDNLAVCMKNLEFSTAIPHVEKIIAADGMKEQRGYVNPTRFSLDPKRLS